MMAPHPDRSGARLEEKRTLAAELKTARLCWHRPGKRTARGFTTCRSCGVGIEECPCTGQWSRSADPLCKPCGGSGWCAIVRGWIEALQEKFGTGPITRASGHTPNVAEP
jgi:hypothetical protein